MNVMKLMNLRNTLHEGLADIFHVWSMEMRNVFRDAGVLIFFILVPLGYPLVYAFIYTNETVHEVPVVAVDDSHSSTSREFLRKVDGAADVHIVARAADMDEAKSIMREKGAYGTIYIPAEFDERLMHGEQATVSLFCDMSGLLYYKALLSTCTEVSLDMNRDIQVTRLGGATTREAEVSTRPIEYEYVTLFNPQNGFASFLIPAVLMLIIQQTLLLGVGMSVGTLREKNLFLELASIDEHHHGTLRIVTGKALAYLMIYLLMSAYIACLVPRLFSLVQLADGQTMAAFMLPYLLACIFFSMTASAIIRNRETCMLLFVFTSLPLLFISGISWPEASVPTFWKVLSWVFPSTFGINGYVHINTMGASLADVSTELRALWIQAGVYFVTTCLVYRWQIVRSLKVAAKSKNGSRRASGTEEKE